MQEASAPPACQADMDFAVDIAREAGLLTLELFRQPDVSIDDKEDGSPVTAADREAERLLRERIGTTHPDDAVVGEEEADTEGNQVGPGFWTPSTVPNHLCTAYPCTPTWLPLRMSSARPWV